MISHKVYCVKLALGGAKSAAYALIGIDMRRTATEATVCFDLPCRRTDISNRFCQEAYTVFCLCLSSYERWDGRDGAGSLPPRVLPQ